MTNLSLVSLEARSEDDTESMKVPTIKLDALGLDPYGGWDEYRVALLRHWNRRLYVGVYDGDGWLERDEELDLFLAAIRELAVAQECIAAETEAFGEWSREDDLVTLQLPCGDTAEFSYVRVKAFTRALVAIKDLDGVALPSAGWHLITDESA